MDLSAIDGAALVRIGVGGFVLCLLFWVWVEAENVRSKP